MFAPKTGNAWMMGVVWFLVLFVFSFPVLSAPETASDPKIEREKVEKVEAHAKTPLLDEKVSNKEEDLGIWFQMERDQATRVGPRGAKVPAGFVPLAEPKFSRDIRPPKFEKLTEEGLYKFRPEPGIEGTLNLTEGTFKLGGPLPEPMAKAIRGMGGEIRGDTVMMSPGMIEEAKMMMTGANFPPRYEPPLAFPGLPTPEFGKHLEIGPGEHALKRHEGPHEVFVPPPVPMGKEEWGWRGEGGAREYRVPFPPPAPSLVERLHGPVFDAKPGPIPSAAVDLHTGTFQFGPGVLDQEKREKIQRMLPPGARLEGDTVHMGPELTEQMKNKFDAERPAYTPPPGVVYDPNRINIYTGVRPADVEGKPLPSPVSNPGPAFTDTHIPEWYTEPRGWKPPAHFGPPPVSPSASVPEWSTEPNQWKLPVPLDRRADFSNHLVPPPPDFTQISGKAGEFTFNYLGDTPKVPSIREIERFQPEAGGFQYSFRGGDGVEKAFRVDPMPGSFGKIEYTGVDGSRFTAEWQSGPALVPPPVAAYNPVLYAAPRLPEFPSQEEIMRKIREIVSSSGSNCSLVAEPIVRNRAEGALVCADIDFVRQGVPLAGRRATASGQDVVILPSGAVDMKAVTAAFPNLPIKSLAEVGMLLPSTLIPPASRSAVIPVPSLVPNPLMTDPLPVRSDDPRILAQQIRDAVSRINEVQGAGTCAVNPPTLSPQVDGSAVVCNSGAYVAVLQSGLRLEMDTAKMEPYYQAVQAPAQILAIPAEVKPYLEGTNPTLTQ